MKISLRAKPFLDALSPSIDVATKDFDRDWIDAEKLTIESTTKFLRVFAHGGRSSIISILSNDTISELEYECEEEGKFTVNANDLFQSLSSFPKSEKISLTIGEGEVEISYVSDVDKEVQPVVLESEEVIAPTIAKEFTKKIHINREILKNGLDKVAFAAGFAETRPRYISEVVEAEDDRIRFISGTGARFAIYDVKGKGITNTNTKEQFILPKQNIKHIITVLKNATDENVELAEAEANIDNDSPAQILLKAGHMALIMVGINTELDYPDVDKVLSNDYDNEVETDLDNWQYAIQGIKATNSPQVDEENDVHNTDITLDKNKQALYMETRSRARAKRYIKYNDVAKSKGEKPSFRCNSAYLIEVALRGGQKGEMTLFFNNRPEDSSQSTLPVIARYGQKTNEAQGTTEDFMIFFATSK